jgi:hypothetical protein
MTECSGKTCRHVHQKAGPHCSEMACSNYSEKCPAHRIVREKA